MELFVIGLMKTCMPALLVKVLALKQMSANSVQFPIAWNAITSHKHAQFAKSHLYQIPMELPVSVPKVWPQMNREVVLIVQWMIAFSAQAPKQQHARNAISHSNYLIITKNVFSHKERKNIIFYPISFMVPKLLLCSWLKLHRRALTWESFSECLFSL